jgi:hypothetical protein
VENDDARFDVRGWLRPSKMRDVEVWKYLHKFNSGEVAYGQDYEAAWRGDVEAAKRVEALAEHLTLERLRER